MTCKLIVSRVQAPIYAYPEEDKTSAFLLQFVRVVCEGGRERETERVLP